MWNVYYCCPITTKLKCADKLKWKYKRLIHQLIKDEVYRVSIKSFLDYKHLLQENYVEYKYIFLPLLKLVSKILCHVIWFLDATFPNRWIVKDGPTPWPSRSPDITPLDFFLWGYVKDKVFSTPVPDTTNLKGKNNRRFCYNNWRHVGEHVERNRLSIRRSPCNKRSTCWSVLKCCKKLLEKNFLSYIKKNCIPRTVVFL